MDDHNYGFVLQYGNPGPASYSSDTQSWHFARRFRPSHTISYTGITSRAVPPSFSDSPVVKKDNEQERELLREYPELIGLTSSYARDEERSRFISQVTSYFDPQISSLFEFGSARLSKTYRWTSRLQTVPIAALASGKNGNVLSFCAIDDEPIYTDDITNPSVNSSSVRVPTISSSNIVNWVCGEAPIRQIRFADSFEKSECLFAVRLLSRTSIFRPIYYEESLLINPPQNADGEHSKIQLAHIDPNPIAEIDLSQTGGYAHVDVTFNPWYQKQFAIIDERGHWSVWLIHDLVQHGDGVTPERLHSGFLPCLTPNKDEEQDRSDQIPYDGWGRIQWISDIYTFIVCSRRTAMIYVTEEATLVSYDVRLNWQSPAEWILDVKTSLQQPSHVFILTTLRILCFNVNSREPKYSFLLPQFSWQHSRDADDLTLRLTSLTVGQEYYLLLYSRLDSCILAFQTPIDQSDNPRSSMSDPFYVYIPGIADSNGLKTIRYESPIRQVLFKELEQTPLGPRIPFTQNSRLMKLFVLDNALAIQEYVFSQPYNPSSEGEVVNNPEILSFGKALAIFRKKQQQTATHITLDVGDNFHADREAQRADKPGQLPVQTRRVVNFSRVYALLSTGDTRYLRKPQGAALEYQSFRDYVGHLIATLLTSAEDEPAFMQTMLEIAKKPPASSDIDECIQEIESFKSRFASTNTSAEIALCFLPLKVSAIPLQEEARSIRSFQPFDLLRLYKQLMGDWLSPLPRTIPSWTRIYKEKLIRQVSIDLSLASMIRVDVSVSNSDALVSSQVSISQQTGFGEDKADASDKITEQDEEHQKKHHILDLKTVAPQSMGIPAAGAAQEVLSHWTIGNSPGSFDWEKVFAMDAGERSTRSQSKERTRTRTRSRSRATSEGLKVLRSSPIVPIVQYSGSQPQQDFSRQVLPSSQINEDPLPMSQVERGLFGSREAGKRSNVKARKKKRAAGF